MVWCNAFTELGNAKAGLTRVCVYYTDSAYTTPIRAAVLSETVDTTAGGQDDPYENPDADGFRLPNIDEWELTARWRGSAENSVAGYRDPWFTTGNSASGAITFYNDSTEGSGEPGKAANDAFAVYGYYWNGSTWAETGVTQTAVVKSKGANAPVSTT